MTNELMLLSAVCGEYFCLTERVAQRKAANGLLPVPAFRIAGTRKGPFYIRSADLNTYMEKQYQQAAKLNSQMKNAGLV
jgi:hypothetical protein